MVLEHAYLVLRDFRSAGQQALAPFIFGIRSVRMVLKGESAEDDGPIAQLARAHP